MITETNGYVPMLGRVFLGRYETIRLLGEGGMGRVYLARQLDLGRQVVVKVMHDHIAADPTFCERFQRETLLMARFQHPYAVALYDASLNDPQGPCIVMEYIRGETLDAVLTRNQRIDPVRVGKLLHQICEVLYAAHEQGIIHRDLKPANLMVVDPDTPYEIVKVMDFGLAKLLGAEMQSSVTNHEFAVGTPGYMCPEQARGEEMDHRGDLYSMGVILFELLTGHLPFAGRSTMDVLIAHATEEPPSFLSLGVGIHVPPPIERVVLACLAKDPNNRPSTARELSEMYTEALAQVQQSHSNPPLSPPTHTVPPARTSWLKSISLGGSSAQPSQVHRVTTLPPNHPAHAPTGNSHNGTLISPLHTGSAPAPMTVPNPVVVKAPTVTPPPTIDPRAVILQLEAYMPEKIATYKLRGFIQDVGGELVESVPGRINVRLGGKGCVYSPPTRGLSWLGLGRRPAINLELRLQRGETGRENQLKIVVVFTSPGTDISIDESWRAVCHQIFIDLRGYLMGNSNSLTDTVS